MYKLLFVFIYRLTYEPSDANDISDDINYMHGAINYLSLNYPVFSISRTLLLVLS